MACRNHKKMTLSVCLTQKGVYGVNITITERSCLFVISRLEKVVMDKRIAQKGRWRIFYDTTNLICNHRKWILVAEQYEIGRSQGIVIVLFHKLHFYILHLTM